MERFTRWPLGAEQVEVLTASALGEARVAGDVVRGHEAVRLAAAVVVSARLGGLKSGELCSLRVSGFGGEGFGGEVVERYLTLRRRLVGGLGGSDHGRFLVTVWPSGTADEVYALGMPLLVRGWQDSWRRFVRRVNVQQVGAVGFPVATRWELMRRGQGAGHAR